jgi:hypothetical protein
MVDAVEPDQAYHDEVEGDDIVQQSWRIKIPAIRATSGVM